MAKKITIITLEHECQEDPCHLNNSSQEAWIRGQLEGLSSLKWNWKVSKIRIIDAPAHD